MKKNNAMLNLVFSLIYCLLLIVVNLSDNLPIMLLLFIISYVFFFIYSKIKLEKVKYMLSSPGFIYGSVFVPYVIFAVAMFIADGYQSRIHFFTNNLYTMILTTKMYLNIYLILLLILTLFNMIKKFDIKEMVITLESKIKKLFYNITLLDLFCMVFALLNVYKLLSYGLSYFSLSTLQKRAVFSSEINHYINVFMTLYSLIVTIYFVNDKNNLKKGVMIFRILFMVIYWGIFLTCERRMFVAYLVGFMILVISKVDRVKIKNIVITSVTIILLLLSASFRGNITFGKNDPRDVIYMSLTEFICTYSVSNYYVNNIEHLDYAHGETYIKNSFLSLFPRVLVPNKPQELGTIFKKKLNLNVGYSFNPIAEGVLNFGKYAVIFVPIIIALIVLISNKMYKFNVLMPVIISSFSLDFYRGQFANFFFDSVFCFVFVFIIFKLSIKNSKVKEGADDI